MFSKRNQNLYDKLTLSFKVSSETVDGALLRGMSTNVVTPPGKNIVIQNRKLGYA